MIIAFNFIFDIIVAILVYEYFKRDKKAEAFAAAVIVKVAYFISSGLIMGNFNIVALIIYTLVMICVARLYIIILERVYKPEFHAILFIFIAALIGIIIMSMAGEILYTVLFKLVTLFMATFQYTLYKIS